MGGRHWGRLAVALLVLGGGLAYLWHRLEAPANRVYTIGWEDTPPFQVSRMGGEPAGFAVELVREAARRRGIRLRWVCLQRQSESALVQKKVDLWPLLTITEARKKLMHFSDPFLDREFGFLVRSDKPYKRAIDLAHGKVTSSGIAIHAELLRERFPGLVHEASASTVDAIRRTCAGEFEAAFGQQFALYTAVTEQPLCPGTTVRMLPIAGMRAESALASTFEAAPAADALREAIGEIVEDGTAARLAALWSESVNPSVSLERMQKAQRLANRYRRAVVSIAIVCLLAMWAAVGYRRARNRARTETQAREKAERNLRLLASSLSEMVLAYDLNRRLTYANPGAEKLSGYGAGEMALRDLGSWAHEEDRASVLAAWEKAFAGETVSELVYRLVTRGGEERWVSATIRPTCEESGRQIGVQSTERDITRRRENETERAALEQQLVQSQKLESIGRLAGGVAHDFNNLLTVIGGFGRMLLMDLTDQQKREQVEQIIEASDRAADLTRQLLAFSRRQVVEPELMDLNATIEQAAKMIRRLVGEDVEVVIRLDAEVHRILAAPSQIVQVLMNLAANARDAIPAGGTLHIETRNVTLSAEYAASHADVTPGDYVLLTVTDSGVGMDAPTLSRIFEPFFTTKAIGQGTGLGLATVYGIVKQAGGHIWVYSEPNKGTSFKLYLPWAAGDADTGEKHVAAAPAVGGSETVLIVEDQEMVRDLAASVLRSLGYDVLEAAGGDEALRQAAGRDGAIQLLVTDVIMPGMNGRELAAEFTRAHPETRVLYMSGYSDNVVEQRGALEPGVHYLAKPFSPSGLAAKVRQVLDE